MSKFLCLFFISISVWCQTEQAWVYFSPKDYEPSIFNTPKDFLTEKAVSRKNRHEITIDERDLPINQNLVKFVKNTTGISYITQSKWFNAVYVSGTKTDIKALENESFVDSVFFMNRSLNTSTASKRINPNVAKKGSKFQETTDLKYGNTATQINQISLAPLHNSNYTGEGITIAVLDSGFENVDIINGFNRSKTNGKLLGGYDFPNRTEDIYAYKNSDHGTSVLSCMAGFIENQFVGTAPDASYYLFRTEIAEKESPEEEALWIAAAERADSLGVDILNTSLGYTEFDESKYNYTTSDMNGSTTFISQGTTIALEKGMIPVTSAGNTGSSIWRIISAPADSPSTLSVGAVNSTGAKASFSAFGPTSDNRTKPDVAAMGQDTTVLNDQGTIVTSNGTSFSGPVIAGAAACLWQAFPQKKPLEIMNLIRSMGNQANNPDNSIGYGIPNFSKAIDTLTNSSVSKPEQDLVNTFVTHTLKIHPTIKGKEILIFNLQGENIFKTIPKDTSIDIQNLSDGVYIFKYDKNDKGTIFIKN